MSDDPYLIHPAEDPDAAPGHPLHAASEHPLQVEVPQPQAAPPVEGVCAFMVVQQLDGRWVAHLDISKVGPLSVQRAAHRYDALAAFAAVGADINAGIAAETAIAAQMQAAQMIAQQQEARSIAERLGLGQNGRRG